MLNRREPIFPDAADRQPFFKASNEVCDMIGTQGSFRSGSGSVWVLPSRP